MRIPFCPLPLKRAKSVAKYFYRFSRPLASEKMKHQLKVAEMDISARDYAAIAFFTAVFNFLISFSILFVVSLRFVPLLNGLALSLAFSGFIFLMILIYLMIHPRSLMKKKIYDLEKNLLHAVRHMYVMIKSGVPIYDAFVSVANNNYGNVSKEFSNIVNKVNSGESLVDVLEESSLNNPSAFFRRVLWQITNGIQSGADIAIVMGTTIDYLGNEQRIAIRRYGSQLNPMTLMFMMFAVVIPTLGITFLIVLSTISGLNVSENMLWGIMLVVILFQFMFLGLMKSRRPSII